jgi:putative glutamine amidotransferase
MADKSTNVERVSQTDAPRVGIPYRTREEETSGRHSNHGNYMRAIREAGGEPVAISLKLEPAKLKRVAETVDAFVLPGSPADVDPALYGAVRSPQCHPADPARERTDYALIENAFTETKPLLAICYGAQILNVCLGGTLYQDIASELHSPIDHTKDKIAKGAPDPIHMATIKEGGELGQLAAECGLEISGGEFKARVNTSHHQSIRDVGHGLRVAAIAPDGVIEAVEHEPHKHWVVAVQWHPERPTQEAQCDALSAALFRALVAATRTAAARR